MAYQDVENYFKQIYLKDRLIVLDESSATVTLAAGSPNRAVRVTFKELEDYSNYDCYIDVCEDE